MTTRILLADDHTMFRQALVTFLKSNPRLELVGQAGDGEEAWRLIQTLRPDVTVLDIAMPGLGGLDVARRNAEAGYPTRIVMLTMHSDHRLALEAADAGADGFVSKDDTLEELATAINTVMACGTFVTPSLRSVLRGQQRSSQGTVVLSAREREVLRLIAEGRSSKEIARAFDISPRTVDTHRKHLAEKLGVGSVAEMARYAVRVGLVD